MKRVCHRTIATFSLWWLSYESGTNKCGNEKKMGRTCHNYVIWLMQHSVMKQKPHQHRKPLHSKIWYSLHQEARSGEGITHNICRMPCWQMRPVPAQQNYFPEFRQFVVKLSSSDTCHYYLLQANHKSAWQNHTNLNTYCKHRGFCHMLTQPRNEWRKWKVTTDVIYLENKDGAVIYKQNT